MVKVTVDGKPYELDERHVKVMAYLQETIALGDSDIKITTISQADFEFILQILKQLNYDIKEPPKIKNNVIEDFIGKELASLIGSLDAKQLNSLYRAAHFLKITTLRKSIAAVVASRVHIQPTLDAYNAKKAEIKLEKELNTEISKEYKERFPFMN